MPVKINAFIAFLKKGIKINITQRFCIVIQGLQIIYIFKLEKDSIVYVGRIRC